MIRKCAHGWNAAAVHTGRSAAHGEKQRDIVGRVLPIYRKLAGTGQIEISTTPYYHPICRCFAIPISQRLSSRCPLPPRFRYPDDARKQLALAREYCAAHFGAAPVGYGHRRFGVR